MDQQSEEASISYGSSPHSFAEDDNLDENEPTLPPIAGPPSDASYSSSFIEMVKACVERAHENHRVTTMANTEKNEQVDSFASILNFYSSQESDLPFSVLSSASEKQVEKGRRQAQENELPVRLHSQDSVGSLPEFAVIRSDPLSVNHVRYTTNKKKDQEQQVKEALDSVGTKFLFDGPEKELCWSHSPEPKPDSPLLSSQEFSSWLCFDSQGSYANFKHDIEEKVSAIKGKQKESPTRPEPLEKDSHLFADLESKIIMTSTPKRVFDLSKKRV
ncbi:hypothetical protein CU098_005626 [Rhizopus stolonifer]|uniref:Uncharacterized protein n=1 Tax=Rhizopus stolonifer TaxID=4846 RepID=A0A367ISF5_RHIST|nr:hypothetical protein CU098_005626 [Rhizopus stolonifer]